jgi:hypothetical protein
VIERAYVHVAGPKGAGKTALVDAILRSFDGLTIVVRCERDDRLSSAKESKGARDAEVRRYREAGATGAARLRFPGEDEGDSFFTSDVMNDYSNAVVIEGDCPVDYVDLEVFVAPPLPAGAELVERHERPERLEAVDKVQSFFRALADPKGLRKRRRSTDLEELLEASRVYAEVQGRALDALRRGAAAPSLTAEWTIAKSHRGIERASLVVVNVRAGDDRKSADTMLSQIARLRADDEIRAAVLGRFAHRTPVTAVVADLSNRKDPGTKKALARIKRAMARRMDRRAR